MIHIGFDGKYFRDQRHVVNEFCDKFDTEDEDVALNRAGYGITLRLGDASIACIEVYESMDHKCEFYAIALVSFGLKVHIYTTDSIHGLMLFLKEFSPIIESTLRLQNADLK